MNVEPATLHPNAFVDSDHPAIVDFARRTAGGMPPKEAAIALFYAVRDGVRYNPWRVRFAPGDYKASGVLLREPSEGGHCIDKANLLAAAARAVGIPSRLHFADVRNHIGTARLEAKLGSDRLVYHGYTELYLADSLGEMQWVAATPAFNVELCSHLGVAPLEFDGEHDAIFQEYNPADSANPTAGRFMEYIEDHGVFVDIPVERMVAAWRKHYPLLVEQGGWPERD